MTITYQDMLERYWIIRHKADRIARVRQNAALRAAAAAGVGDQIGTTGHNAMIAYREGKPWKGIDYAMLRRAFWLMEKSFEPRRIADQAWARLYDQWRADGFKYRA